MTASTVQITQGTTTDLGQTRLGFTHATAQDGARFDLWSEQDKVWVTHLQLHQDQVFPTSAGFQRVASIEFGGPRAVVMLQAEDSHDIHVPAADQPILPLYGSLDMGLTRIEMTDPPANGTVRVRLWPKLHPLAKTAPEDVRQFELGPGMTLEFGTRSLRVERIQEDEGSMPAFVVFSTQP